MKPQNSQTQKIIPLIKNVPEKYKDCPADLLWAVQLDMNQDTNEFQNWIAPIKAQAEAKTRTWARETQKSKFKLIK